MAEVEIKAEEQTFDEMESITTNGNCGDSSDAEETYSGGGAYFDGSQGEHEFPMQDPFGMKSDLDFQDEGLFRLLAGWKLSHLYRELFAQKINLDVLKIIKPKHVDKLFRHTPLGDQIRFEHYLEKWRTSLSIPVQSDTIKQTRVVAPKDGNSSSSNNHYLETPPSPTLPGSRFEAANISPSVYNAQRPSNVARNDCSTKQFLAKILKSTSNGKMIQKYYDKHNALHEEQRNALINTIARFIEAEGCGLTLAESAQVEKQIVEIFPTEKLEFYTTGKRGRIYNKVANLKRCSKPLAIVEHISTPVAKKTYVPEADAIYYVGKLRSDVLSCDEFKDCWKRCSQYRFRQIVNLTSIEEILSKWPEYKQHNGLHLIDIDFSLKYNAATTLAALWSERVDKLETLLRHKIFNSTTSVLLQDLYKCNEASRDLTILWALHHLFPPAPTSITASDGAKIKKRFTTSDSQDAFLVIGTTAEELENKLQILKLLGRPIQPCLLAVGRLNNIREIWLYMDGHRFAVPQQSSVLATDLCLKIFLALDIEYTEESSIFYNFIQAYFFGIPPLKKNTRISIIINELNSKTC